MALLQISEPGQSPLPHQNKYAIGIDLGTTNSLVSIVRSGMAKTLTDEQGRHLLPLLFIIVKKECAQWGMRRPPKAFLIL